MKNYPRIFQYTIILFFIALVYGFMSTLAFYLVPATFGALLAMLMLPINRWLERHKCPRVLAIILTLLLILGVIAGIITLFSSEVVKFAGDMPTIRERLTERFNEFSSFIERTTGITSQNQLNFIHNGIDKLMSSAGAVAGDVLATTGGTLAAFGLMVIHYVLFLLYRNRIRNFILQIVNPEEKDVAQIIIEAITKVTRQYLTGVVAVMAILSVLNSVGLLIIGVPNAIFFGVLAAVLNIIPYIGIWIGVTLPVVMAIIAKDSLIYPLAVIALFMVTQFFDNNYLTPRITGSQIKLNALAVIVIIIIGNLVWGLAGMILFIPMLGILKVLFDHVPALHPYGYLIGEETEESNNFFTRWKERRKQKRAHRG